MREPLPLAVMCRGSSVTHGHDISKAACGAYCVAARHILHGTPVVEAFREGFKRAHVQLELPQPSGSGYVLDSLSFAARAAASGGSYEDVVLIAIRLGADTDTTAAIAGGIVALRDGMDAIPQRWLDLIRGKELANGIIDSFLTSRELRSQTHVTCPSCDGLGCLMCDNTGQIPRPRLLPGETF